MADRTGLGRAIQGLCIRMARGLNRLHGRVGRVFSDRYHARVLRTPHEVRHALAYVLNNARRHGIVGPRAQPGWLDPYSSARLFEGWRRRVEAGSTRGSASALVGPPVAEARSWLLRVGWRRLGLLDPSYVPG